ncbi:MFS transporter [Alphaproteobacteria bacterium]|jgi:MFS family permease|nr:MFS transporter [Alphaproteobacteria bacterium]
MTSGFQMANVIRLAIAQALSMTSMNVNIINTALVGALLAPVPWMATVPLSLQFVTSMMTTLPASLLMARFGRRPVFMIGVLISCLGAVGEGMAIIIDSFLLFCISSMALGIAMGCSGFYRYAAADGVDEQQKPRAISYVLTGGLLAALLGPEIVRNTVDLLPNAIYAGCFFVVAGVQLISLFFLAGLKIKKPERAATGGRPIGVFLRMPVFVVGLITSALGFGLMSYIMTATPLQVVNVAKLGHSANATVIQWHVVAMFAPSFFTGNLIARFGVSRILWAGLAAYVVTIVMALNAVDFWTFWWALALCGLGWNFLFIGGTSLVAQAALPHERGRVQGFADLMVTSTVALSSLTAGAIHSQLGWHAMSMVAIGPIVVIGVALVWLSVHLRREAITANI